MIAINSVMTASLNRERCKSHGEGEEEELDLKVDEKELPYKQEDVNCDLDCGAEVQEEVE